MCFIHLRSCRAGPDHSHRPQEGQVTLVLTSNDQSSLVGPGL